MTYASISVDRRAEYYVKVAPIIPKNMLDFYTRAEAGRKVQRGVKKKDLTLNYLMNLGKLKQSNVVWPNAYRWHVEKYCIVI